MNLVLIVMGVSGCGKSTFGRLLAERLDLPFIDEDDFQSGANINKMGIGFQPTADQKREILQTLSRKLAEYNDADGIVLAAAALTESERTILGTHLSTSPLFIYLQGNLETIQQQIERRSGHFFPPELLAREFQVLEEPQDAITVNLHPSLDFADSVEGLILELM